VVDQPCNELLAGARFPGNVYGRLTACDARDHLPQRLHYLRVADEARTAYRQVAIAFTELDGARDELAQHPEVERLRDKVERAELERAHRGLHVAVGRDHRDRYQRLVLLDPG